ncbi:hypothetical protein C1Y63_11825 [Corynebacterium sp. 13CS0277]|uniref:hypothetical protein n=1 Tax=Corynebacterium sp. 13CS0277 TaxID=2071994 RepID=UPI000D0235D2|nr:hypothetical protein [Corynebacterium sp. 13CS0277]PRQ10380.1 hypothetical protein C1Y63_11825 [Corynebacterium sp. 13CS0277]
MSEPVFDAATGRTFHVGGHEGTLSPEEELLQIDWYMGQHHPQPQDPHEYAGWVARLPDRLTHAAMMVLGAARDHSWPGTNLGAGLTISTTPVAEVFTPDGQAATGPRVLALRPEGLDDTARAMAWQPPLAALAVQAGAEVWDLHDPAALSGALAAAQSPLVVLGAGSAARTILRAAAAGELSPATCRIVLSRPDIPDTIDPATALAGFLEEEHPDRLLVLSGTHDVTVTAHPALAGHTTWLPATHHVCTPATARERVRLIAEFIRR